MQSPLLPVVEEMAKQALKQDGKKERIETKVLDKLIDQIMTGKYRREEKNGLDKVMGINFAQVLDTAQDNFNLMSYETMASNSSERRIL